jgi:hypothetical protein
MYEIIKYLFREGWKSLPDIRSLHISYLYKSPATLKTLHVHYIIYIIYIYYIYTSLKYEVHPRTGHEGLEGE